MNRYEVKIRTPKGNETQVRIVETVARNSWSAGCIVLQLLGIDSAFTLSVHCISRGVR